jgi:Right handed beta helix region
MLAALWVALAALGATPVYVQPGAGCDDDRKAETAAHVDTPVCSIPRALELAEGRAAVVLRGGTYPALEVDGYHPPGWVTVRPYRDEAVTLQGLEIADTERLQVDGVRIEGAATIRGSDRDVALTRSEIGDQRSGLWVYGEGAGISHLRIEHNSIHDIDYPEPAATDGAAGYGIRLQGTLSEVDIRGNRVSRVVEDYIQGGGDRITVEGNLFEGPSLRGHHADAIHSDLWQVYWPGSELAFRGNVALRTGTQNGLLFQFSDKGRPHRHVVISDNVFDHASDGTDMQIYNTDGLTIARNVAVGSAYGTMLRVDDRVPEGGHYRVVDNVLEASAAEPLADETGLAATARNTLRRGP